MNIENRFQTPDSTYFTASDVCPRIVGDVIALTTGTGTKRSWGAPQVTNTIVVNECDFTAIHCGWSHKHRGGQGWYYFVECVTPGLGLLRRTWTQLTDDERQLVLDNEDIAPAWAKSPGRLRADYTRPTDTRFTGYKVLFVTGPTSFESLFDSTTWELGRRNGQAVGENAGTSFYPDGEVAFTRHNGGFYVHTDPERIMALWHAGTLVPKRCVVAGTYALVECECSGRVREFSSGKRACTYCKPLTIIDTWEV